MSYTRKQIVSRLRNSIKEVGSDSPFTNRYLWNVFRTKSQILLKQESERSRLYNQSDIWKTICVPMDSVSPILCTCLALPMDCVVYRSRFKLPLILEGAFGKLYRFISSPDLSIKMVLVTPYQYSLKQTKYNREKYVFIHDGYLWAPNTSWPYILLSAIFEGEIGKEFKCGDDTETTTDCGSLLYVESGVPDWLVEPAIQMALQELGSSTQLVPDENPNTNPNEKQISS